MFAENENYKYLGILEADTIKQIEMKNKIEKEYLWRTRNCSSKALEQKPYQWNKYLAVPLVRYSGPFLKWTRDKLRQMDPRTRKLMTMNKALHPKTTLTDYMYQEKRRKRTCQHQ